MSLIINQLRFCFGPKRSTYSNKVYLYLNKQTNTYLLHTHTLTIMNHYITYNPEIHTDEYGAWYNKLIKAQTNFDNNPNKSTATILSDLKLYPKYSQMYKNPQPESPASKYIREQRLEAMDFAFNQITKIISSK